MASLDRSIIYIAIGRELPESRQNLKYDRECNLFVAFLFVLPVFGALLWAEVWATMVF